MFAFISKFLPTDLRKKYEVGKDPSSKTLYYVIDYEGMEVSTTKVGVVPMRNICQLHVLRMSPMRRVPTKQTIRNAFSEFNELLVTCVETSDA